MRAAYSANGVNRVANTTIQTLIPSRPTAYLRPMSASQSIDSTNWYPPIGCNAVNAYTARTALIELKSHAIVRCNERALDAVNPMRTAPTSGVPIKRERRGNPS